MNTPTNPISYPKKYQPKKQWMFKAHRQAFERINYLSRPGQKLKLQLALDILTDIWNISDIAINGERPEQDD